MAPLTLDSVTKRFGDVVAVDTLSLDIADGELLVLVGPSGCGKSTTLRMIAGLETVTAGDIRLDGESITGKAPKERNIAMVFQNYALYPHMTVRENMKFGLEESTDMSAEEINRTVTEAAEMLDIPELLDRKPTELSGGQQQRVALGRAIVRDPAAFLLDEPLSNLDAKLRAQMRTELQRLQEELGTTTVYVTHDQTEAMTMGDRIAILNDGRLQQVGTPLELYHQPVNEFVAGFIGEPSMNFFTMERQGDRLANGRFAYSLSAETRQAVGQTSPVTLGIRPEDVSIGDRSQGDHEYEVMVDVVEPRGNANDVYLSFDDGDPHTFVAVLDGLETVETGESVVARIPEAAIHLFDAETGQALHNRSLESLSAAESRV